MQRPAVNPVPPQRPTAATGGTTAAAGRLPGTRGAVAETTPQPEPAVRPGLFRRILRWFGGH